MKKIITAASEQLKKLAASAKKSKSTAPLLFLLCGMLLLTLSFPYKKVCTWQVSAVVTDSSGRPMTGTLSSQEEWSMPIPLEKMGRWLPAAAVALEDRRFYTHRGIDAAAIIRAALQNSRSGETISGGSTITSQVIRLAIERKRTIPNKLIEFWQAWQLEQFLTKDGILELYLNRAPFGGNIGG